MAKKKAAKRSPSKRGTSASKSRPGTLKTRSVKSAAASSVRGGGGALATPTESAPRWKLNHWRPTSGG